MKKLIVSTLATCAAIGALAQGSLNIDASVANNPGVTTQGSGATSTSLSGASALWYNSAGAAGNNLSIAVWASSTATAGDLTAINALLNTSGGANTALTDLANDGFSEVSFIAGSFTTIGAVSGNDDDGTVNFANGTVELSTTFAPNQSLDLALVGTALSGADSGWEGVIAFANSYGGNGNPATDGGTAGTASSPTGWGADNENLVLSPVPEPATLAFAGLGGLSMLLIRRRK
jgi:hypothetical protein